MFSTSARTPAHSPGQTHANGGAHSALWGRFVWGTAVRQTILDPVRSWCMFARCPKTSSAPMPARLRCFYKSCCFGMRVKTLEKLKIRHEVPSGSHPSHRELRRQNIFRCGLPQLLAGDSGIRASRTWQEPYKATWWPPPNHLSSTGALHRARHQADGSVRECFPLLRLTAWQRCEWQQEKAATR